MTFYLKNNTINLPQVQELKPFANAEIRIFFLLEKLSRFDAKNLSPEECSRAEHEGEDAIDDDDVIKKTDADG